MAPKKPASKGKSSSSKGSSSKKSAPRKPSSAAPSGISKRKQKSMSLAKPGGAQKTKSLLPSSSSSAANKKKKRMYAEAELEIPKLNGIVPAGIAKPHGQKKGKKFVDDPESVMAIMSMVSAEKDGAVESKIMRARQLEEVREAKRKEEEKRREERENKFEEKKRSLKKKRRGSAPAGGAAEEGEGERESVKDVKKKKRVSFG